MPAFASPPQARSAETPPAASSVRGASSVQSEAAHEDAPPQGVILESPVTISPALRNPLDLTHGRFALQPLDVYGGTLATALPNGGPTQALLSRDAKIIIIVAAIVVGVLLIVTVTYGRPCCGPP